MPPVSERILIGPACIVAVRAHRSERCSITLRKKKMLMHLLITWSSQAVLSTLKKFFEIKLKFNSFFVSSVSLVAIRPDLTM